MKPAGSPPSLKLDYQSPAPRPRSGAWADLGYTFLAIGVVFLAAVMFGFLLLVIIMVSGS